jgi:hypothetical protein
VDFFSHHDVIQSEDDVWLQWQSVIYTEQVKSTYLWRKVVIFPVF